MLAALLLIACVNDVEDALDYDPVMTVDADEAEAACAEGGQEVDVPATWTADVLRDVEINTGAFLYDVFDPNVDGDCDPNEGFCWWSFERGDVFAPPNLIALVDCERGAISEDASPLSLSIYRGERGIGHLHIEPALD